MSEQKIEPQVPVELKEGDTLRLGASTRMYRLQWVSFSHVFEVENPINSSAPIPEEKEEAYQVRKGSFCFTFRIRLSLY